MEFWQLWQSIGPGNQTLAGEKGVSEILEGLLPTAPWWGVIRDWGQLLLGVAIHWPFLSWDLKNPRTLLFHPLVLHIALEPTGSCAAGRASTPISWTFRGCFKSSWVKMPSVGIFFCYPNCTLHFYETLGEIKKLYHHYHLFLAFLTSDRLTLSLKATMKTKGKSS